MLNDIQNWNKITYRQRWSVLLLFIGYIFVKITNLILFRKDRIILIT